MEPAQSKMNFGRQPQPVKVTIDGESEDVDFWVRHLMRAAQYKGDDIDQLHGNIFRICPRAVND